MVFVPGDRERAEALAKSPRGAYILSQALTLAVEDLETEERGSREPSNLADMRLMRDELFPAYYLAERAAAKYRLEHETLREAEESAPPIG